MSTTKKQATTQQPSNRRAVEAIRYAQTILALHLEQLQGRDVHAEAQAAYAAVGD